MKSQKSLVTAFSLPKETLNLLNHLQIKFKRSRSEILREMIEHFVQSQKTSTKRVGDEGINDSDANKILKLYYSLLSQTKPKTTIVIVIGIVNKKDKVIIGLRKSPDPNIRDLHWTFPSGKTETLDFEKTLTKTIKDETGLNAKPIRLVHARLIPDSPDKKIRIVAL